jgi:transcriptional regulator with XRE-family HTH domain
MAAPHPLALELRHTRERAGISQQVLADRLGVARITVTAWENGYREPRTLTQLQSWAAALGRDITLTPHITEGSTA